MSQDQVLLLLFKIVLILDEAAVLLFVADYTRLTKGRAWRRDNPIGRSILIKDALLALAFLPSLLSLFLNFNRLTSRIALWMDVVLFAGIAVAMVWRVVVFERVHRDKKAAAPAEDEGGT